MKKLKFSLIFLAIVFFTSCASHRQDSPTSVLEITEDTPSKKTGLVKQNLIHLAQVYDLHPMLFIKKIHISTTPPPVTSTMISIDTSFYERPNQILSQFLHAELHVWMLLNRDKVALAVADLKKIYPKIPVEIKNGDKINGYSHLIICYLEHEALSFYLGRKQAKVILSGFMKKKQLLPWTYYQVLNRNFAIKQVVEKHSLLPSPLH